jgi:hypothetical protein
MIGLIHESTSCTGSTLGLFMNSSSMLDPKEVTSVIDLELEKSTEESYFERASGRPLSVSGLI